MARPLSPTLLANRTSDATTECLVMWVAPVTPGYAGYGVAMLDRPVRYDHGNGERLYSPIIGFQPSTLLQSADLSVNNAEATGLMPEFEVPVSEADIIAGVYDFAEYTVYLVDYENLTAGSGLIMSEGQFGRVTVNDFGLSIVNELRGLTDQLKQSLCRRYSIGCPATFGSGAIGSGAEVEELYPCGFDLSTITETSSVASVGLENTLTFTLASGFDLTEDELQGGMVKFTSGNNAGRSYEIEGNTTAGVITLAFPTQFPIAEDDELTYRPGCSKQARDTVRGCKKWFGAEWIDHFRGHPDIPIGDEGSIETPGASAGPGQGAPINQEFDAE